MRSEREAVLVDLASRRQSTGFGAWERGLTCTTSPASRSRSCSLCTWTSLGYTGLWKLSNSKQAAVLVLQGRLNPMTSQAMMLMMLAQNCYRRNRLRD